MAGWKWEEREDEDYTFNLIAAIAGVVFCALAISLCYGYVWAIRITAALIIICAFSCFLTALMEPPVRKTIRRQVKYHG